jgi:hypothetical protein
MARETTGPTGPDEISGETRWSLAMLLGPPELQPRGWKVVEERTWPTGQLDPTSEKSQRALEAGGITAWRSLEHPEAKRSMWVEVVPYASAADAELSLRQVPRFFVGVAEPDEEVTGERVMDDQDLPDVSDTWVYEKSIDGPRGATVSRYVAGTVERILFLTCFSTPGEPWPWVDVVELSGLQAHRVRRCLQADAQK